MMVASPKVSCLCLSYKRVESLKNVVKCFQSQTYENKELVLVYRSTDEDTKAFVNSLDDDRIKPVEVIYQDDTTLGDVRNISIAESTGDYICIWDDDDWYHSERIAAQMNAITTSGKQASVLFYILMYDKKNGVSYMSPRHTWEQTLLCSKELLSQHGIEYPALNRGEDAVFVKQLIELNAIVPVVNPELYVYCYNAQNTCDASHFEMLFGYAQKLNSEHTEVMGKVYECEYDVAAGSSLLSNSHFLSELRYVWDAPAGRR